jgi:hypothetical protein
MRTRIAASRTCPEVFVYVRAHAHAAFRLAVTHWRRGKGKKGSGDERPGSTERAEE